MKRIAKWTCLSTLLCIGVAMFAPLLTFLDPATSPAVEQPTPQIAWITGIDPATGRLEVPDVNVWGTVSGNPVIVTTVAHGSQIAIRRVTERDGRTFYLIEAPNGRIGEVLDTFIAFTPPD